MARNYDYGGMTAIQAQALKDQRERDAQQGLDFLADVHFSLPFLYGSLSGIRINLPPPGGFRLFPVETIPVL